mmetsp:Transcript_28722/g.84707  ORF Transcript_28722/g.84707 Transcript_28722/m.84707 type:complete len:342 (+) Transcript_28722:2245-3270(+)
MKTPPAPGDFAVGRGEGSAGDFGGSDGDGDGSTPASPPRRSCPGRGACLPSTVSAAGGGCCCRRCGGGDWNFPERVSHCCFRSAPNLSPLLLPERSPPLNLPRLVERALPPPALAERPSHCFFHSDTDLPLDCAVPNLLPLEEEEADLPLSAVDAPERGGAAWLSSPLSLFPLRVLLLLPPMLAAVRCGGGALSVPSADAAVVALGFLPALGLGLAGGGGTTGTDSDPGGRDLEPVRRWVAYACCAAACRDVRKLRRLLLDDMDIDSDAHADGVGLAGTTKPAASAAVSVGVVFTVALALAVAAAVAAATSSSGACSMGMSLGVDSSVVVVVVVGGRRNSR